jgi:hypothetical protein
MNHHAQYIIIPEENPRFIGTTLSFYPERFHPVLAPKGPKALGRATSLTPGMKEFSHFQRNIAYKACLKSWIAGKLSIRESQDTKALP